MENGYSFAFTPMQTVTILYCFFLWQYHVFIEGGRRELLQPVFLVSELAVLTARLHHHFSGINYLDRQHVL